ncbi:sigma-70 family RNA polymerase sigma factor [Fictibacillus sp. 18YEL24]|nr:sigma-70 family RNA polymerase sigma factor [Fictibacillus sp. 18YEL24]
MSKEEIMEQLMKEYGNDILYLCYTYVRNWSTAEDLAQDIFIKCYMHLHTFRREANIKTWLFRIASNHCKDYLKSAHYRYSLVTAKIQHFIKGTPNQTVENLMVKEEKHELFTHIFALPLKYREIIYFFYYEEMSLKEISLLIGIKIGTVKTRLFRAKVLLKDSLEKGDE